MSGVYGVFSNGEIERRPKQRYEYFVGFGCSPDNADKLTKAVFDLVATVKKEGVDQETVDKVKEQRRRGLETSQEENRFWSRKLVEHYRHGTDPRRILELEKMVERVTPANVQKAAKKYLVKQYVDALLMPEAGVAKGEAEPAAAKKAPAANGEAKKTSAAKGEAKKAAAKSG